MNIVRKQRMTKNDVLNFFEWYLNPKNNKELENKSFGYIQDLYVKSCGISISYSFLVKNIGRWYLKHGFLYEIRDNLHLKHQKVKYYDELMIKT